MSTPPPLPGARASAPPPSRSNVLWIVLAAIGGFIVIVGGMLAAIALPAYNDYTLRAKVSQATTATASVQSVMAEGMVGNAAVDRADCEGMEEWGIPEQVPMGGALPPQPIAYGELEDGSCAFELQLKGLGADLEGKTLLFSAYHDDDGGIGWDCSGGSLETRFRPSTCRGGSP